MLQNARGKSHPSCFPSPIKRKQGDIKIQVVLRKTEITYKKVLDHMTR